MEDYEREIGARSKGLVRGRSAWNDGKETWLVDFPLVVLIINRLRTAQARKFRAVALEQTLVLMPGREDIAKGLADYWRQEHMCRPDNALLQFMGAAVDHGLPAAETSSNSNGGLQQTQSHPVASEEIVRMCSETFVRSVPELMRVVLDTFAFKIDQMLRDTRATQSEWMDKVLVELRCPSHRQIVNVNTSHRDSSDQERINLEVANEDDATRIRLSALPVSRFVKQQWRREWSAVSHTSFVGTFATLLYSRKMKELGERPALYAGQLGRAQPHYNESDRPLMEKCWDEDALFCSRQCRVKQSAIRCQDAWPILREKLKQKHVLLPGHVSAPVREARQQQQPRIDEYFLMQQRRP